MQSTGVLNLKHDITSSLRLKSTLISSIPLHPPLTCTGITL